jgi:hypothetical protein
MSKLRRLSGEPLAPRGVNVNPEDPVSAQQIVAEYARVLDRDLQKGMFPVPVDSLPFAKPAIETAIKTSVIALASSGQLTDDLREFLQTAYVSLADYVAADLVQLMSEYTRAADDLTTDHRMTREKTTGPAWQRLTESSRLAGEIARSIALDAARLRTEFQRLT